MSGIEGPVASHLANCHEVMRKESGTLAVIVMVSPGDGRHTQKQREPVMLVAVAVAIAIESPADGCHTQG